VAKRSLFDSFFTKIDREHNYLFTEYRLKTVLLMTQSIIMNTKKTKKMNAFMFRNK